MTDTIYEKTVIDFVTVAVEFCAFLEKEEIEPRREWVGSMLKILPLMYVKASLLPDTSVISDEDVPIFVKEEDYSRVANRVAEIMGDEDAYLDVFVDDMKYSDTPVSAFVSENIADMYQDVRNFVSVYQYGLTEQMNDALHACVENFREYWGQKLVNVLRPLHALMYRDEEITEDETENMEELWD